ncbi:MAG TPA: hypothetical protein VFY48_11405 [Solirubrobacterales bacterium]|nr:hypothetical protein [Solirubrobacterales bacterium]
MSPTWEYARIYLSRDPQSQDPVPVWLQLPGDKEWTKREEDKFWALVEELGADGWELVGPPTVQHGVFTYKAATDVWHDRSLWLEQTYLFKRRRAE